MFSLDVSQGTLACALMDPEARVPQWEGVVANTASQVASLLTRVPVEVPWVMEPTGRYSLSVAKQALAAGRKVLLAPPKQAKHYLQSLPARAKTDRVDARGLGLFALSRKLPPYPVKTEDQERLTQLLAARKGISASLATLQQRLPELPYAREALEHAILALRAELKPLDRQIAREKDASPAAARLRQVHGIGPVTAAAVGVCLAQKQFTHPDQFVAYIGLDLRVSDSGKHRGRRQLTRHGDAELRRLLYLCAQASVRASGSPFKAQYERELAKGLPTTAALCAVARKMARVCWSLARHGTDYDPARVYRQL